MKTILKNIPIYCDKIIVGLLLATVITVPLFFDIRLYSVFDLSKVMALYLLTIAILVVWSIALVFKHGFKFSHTAIDIPILAYIFIFIISSIISINPIMSLFGTYKRFEGLTATLCYILLFYTTANFVTTKKRLYLLVIAIVAGATVSSVYGIAQHLGFDIFKWSSFEARRVFSTFGNPVFFSAYLVMTLPLAVVLFFIGNRHILWVFFVLSAIIYTTFWLTNTRACFVALLGGLTPLLFFIFKKQSAERYKFVALIISFVLIGIFFNVRHETSVIKHFASEVNTADNPPVSPFKGGVEIVVTSAQQIQPRPWIAQKFSVAGSSFSRIFQYLAATRIIKDYPALGIGPDTIGIVYQKNLAKVFSVQESDGCFYFPRQDRIHNDILDTAVTRGIFGLGTYIWLLTAFGVFVSKNYKQLSNQNKILILGLLSGIISYLTQNEFSFGNTPIVTLFWVMMGLCISIVKINEAGRSLSTEGRGSRIKGCVVKVSGLNGLNGLSRLSGLNGFCKWIGCGIVVTAIGFATVFVLRFYRADACFEYGRRILEYEKQNLPAITDKGLFFIRRAILLNPYETFYRDELCRTYIQMAFKTKDETWLQKAYVEANNSLKLIPQHYMGFFHLGMIQQFLAEHFGRNTADSAINYYKKAIEADPFQAPFHSNLASLYINKGNLDPAIEELYKAYLIRPEKLNHVDRLANAYLQKGDLESARNILQTFNEAYPNHNYINIHLLLADIYSKNTNWEKVVSECERAIKIDGKSIAAYKMLSIAYYNTNQYELAAETLNQTLTLDPDDQVAKDLLVKISNKIKKNLQPPIFPPSQGGD